MIIDTVKICRDCGQQPAHGRRPYCKGCRNARERAAYAAIPLEVRAQIQLDRYYANHERRKEINRRVTKSWHEKNHEKSLEQYRKFRKVNPDYQKRWRMENPSKAKAIWDNRRARKKNAEGTYTDRDWLEIVYRQQSCCISCGIFCDLTVDHVIPLSRGGTNWPSNLQGLCKPCNCSKNDSLNYQFVVS